MRVFPIYTCGHHGNSNIPTATKTLTHLGFAASASAPPRLLHLIHQRVSMIERAGLRIRHPHRSFTRGRRIRFLGSDLCDCSLISSSSSPRLVYLFVGLTWRVVVFNANFIRLITVFIRSSSLKNRKSRMVLTLKSCLTYLIC
jgi:hypothetical protein